LRKQYVKMLKHTHDWPVFSPCYSMYELTIIVCVAARIILHTLLIYDHGYGFSLDQLSLPAAATAPQSLG
jgi:hypothetical protein